MIHQERTTRKFEVGYISLHLSHIISSAARALFETVTDLSDPCNVSDQASPLLINNGEPHINPLEMSGASPSRHTDSMAQLCLLLH